MLEKCSGLVRDSSTAASYWDMVCSKVSSPSSTHIPQIRKKLGASTTTTTTTPAEGSFSADASTAAVQRELADCKKRLAAALRRAETAEENAEAVRQEYEREELKLEKNKRLMKEDVSKLHEFNAMLEKEKGRLQEREKEVRRRESEMSETMDFMTAKLAPTEQKPRVVSRMAESLAPPSTRRASKRRRLDLAELSFEQVEPLSRNPKETPAAHSDDDMIDTRSRRRR